MLREESVVEDAAAQPGSDQRSIRPPIPSSDSVSVSGSIRTRTYSVMSGIAAPSLREMRFQTLS